MAIAYNLDDNKFLKNRLSYHAASKVGIQTGQSLAQATNIDGHIVTQEQVWTATNQQFPKNTGDNKTTSDVIAATNDLVSVFKNGNQYIVTHILTSDKTFAAGKEYYTKQEDAYVVATVTVGENVAKDTYYEAVTTTIYRNDDYPAVELYESAEMTSVEFSDDQSWELSVGGNRVMDWVTAVSVKDEGKPVPGYSGIIEAYNSKQGWVILQKSAALSYGWELAKGTWEFVPMSGMVIFDPSYIPSKMGYSKIRITAFKYIGEKLNNSIEAINTKHTEDIERIEDTIEDLKQNVGGNISEALGQLEEKHTEDVTRIDGDIASTVIIKKFPFSLSDMTVVENNLTYTVNGFVFQIINNETGLVFGNIEYNTDGSSLIKFGEDDESVFANDDFVAYAFVTKAGNMIPIESDSVVNE